MTVMVIKGIGMMYVILALANGLNAQVTDPEKIFPETELENLAEKTDAVIEDDQHWQELDQLRRHPINLNTAAEEEMESLGFLSALQVRNFIAYRALMGDLISIYELQAIPDWDVETIRKLLPFVFLGEDKILTGTLIKRLKGGEDRLLIRSSEVLERSRGYDHPSDPAASRYLGSPMRIFFRFGYSFRNQLEYGILGDKDAGEPFGGAKQRYGFDFYSFHFFTKKLGRISALALGDFTVNLGQGLIQWQGLAFTKGSDVLAIKRQSPTLVPYRSAGEFNFHRGLGITLEKKNYRGTLFISLRGISSNQDQDTAERLDIVSSFESSGYHRTQQELADKNNMTQFAAGGHLGFSRGPLQLGINGIGYHFSSPVLKRDLPYNLYAIHGVSWSNASIDYSYTHRNIHLFGEFAVDQQLNKAFVQGALIALGQHMDAALLYRYIKPQYHALYANAFTENVSPTNEYGLYGGITVRPVPGLQLDLSFDSFQFPWLRYLMDGPGHGHDFLVQFGYRPTKTWGLLTKFKYSAKTGNLQNGDRPVSPLVLLATRDWRTEFTVMLNRAIKIRSRAEIVWYNRDRQTPQEGWLSLLDIYYDPASKPFQVNGRIQYFETGSYDSRIYAFERDVLYSYSLPAFYNKGMSYYINASATLNRLFHSWRSKKPQLQIWLRWAQTIYQNLQSMGTGLDEIQGRKRSEIKCQIMTVW
jgi:hypothetical protein